MRSSRDEDSKDSVYTGYGPSPQVRAAQEETTAALRRATRQSYATVDVAAETNRALQRQDEQICTLDHTLGETEYQLQRSERHIRATATWRGVIANWFTRTPGGPRRPASTTAELNARAAAKRSTEADERDGTSTAVAPAATAPVKLPSSARDAHTVNDSPSLERSERGTVRQPIAGSSPSSGLIAEDAQLLDELHANVLRLRDHATLQRDMLTRQNEALDNVSAKTGTVQDRLDRNHQNVRKLL